MTHYDQNGNEYRQRPEGWQVMKPGLGWTVFNNDQPITLTDGTVIPAKEQPKAVMSEAEKAILISHARDIHLQLSARLGEMSLTQWEAFKESGGGASVALAKSLIEALEAEGVI